MFSSEGEKVKLSQSISTSAARGAVEKWLLQVQDTMIVSVKDVIEQARDVSTHTHTKKIMEPEYSDHQLINSSHSKWQNSIVRVYANMAQDLLNTKKICILVLVS